MREAIYAGTFDPMTLGHLDVARRAAERFDRLTLAVNAGGQKNVLFDVEERMALARASLEGIDNVVVESFSGLLVEWARRRGNATLIRGLRAISDFEYEFQMALTNRKLAPEVETLFLMPSEEYSCLSTIPKSGIKQYIPLNPKNTLLSCTPTTIPKSLLEEE